MLNYNDNIDELWYIQSDCAAVRIYSETFDLEDGPDILTIDTTKYTGSVIVSQMVQKNFTVQFQSDSSVNGMGFQ